MKRKPKQYEDEPEGNYIAGVGSYQRIGNVSKSKTAQIGFVRKAETPKARRKTK